MPISTSINTVYEGPSKLPWYNSGPVQSCRYSEFPAVQEKKMEENETKGELASLHTLHQMLDLQSNAWNYMKGRCSFSPAAAHANRLSHVSKLWTNLRFKTA